MTMWQLSKDENFHFETLRSLALTRNYGSDIAETLSILPNIKPGDFEDWYREWHNLALRVLSTIDESKPASYSPVTLRDVYFRASHYFFQSDFFLHGNPSDPRGQEAFKLWREYFDKGNAQLPIPGQHVTVPTPHGFDVPIIVYRAAQASSSDPKPLLILGGGFDSNMEEMMHTCGFPALERGYNVVVYEGPGQPSLIRGQGVPFIHDWEKAVTPVVDHIFAHQKDSLAFVDTSKIGLLGYSLGGYLAARAAAFEPRLAAVLCIDGVWSFGDTLFAAFPECKAPFEQADEGAFNAVFDSIGSADTTGRRWIHDHLKFSFGSGSPYKIFQEAMKMDLAGIAERITLPAFIGDATADIFFRGQPAQVARALGSNATLVEFGADQAAAAHCQCGSSVYLNQRTMEWFAEVVGERKI